MASARHATYFPHSDKSIPGSTFWPPDLKEIYLFAALAFPDNGRFPACLPTQGVGM